MLAEPHCLCSPSVLLLSVLYDSMYIFQPWPESSPSVYIVDELLKIPTSARISMGWFRVAEVQQLCRVGADIAITNPFTHSSI